MALTAIGTAAALGELLHLLRSGIELCETIWNAPEEIQSAVVHYRLLHAQTELFVQLFRRNRNLCLLSDEQACHFKSFVDNAGLALSKIENDFAKEIRPSSFPRLQYALQGKKNIKLLLKEMKRVETSISMFLQIVQLQLHCSQISPLHPRQNTEISCSIGPVLDTTDSTLDSIDTPQMTSEPSIDNTEGLQRGSRSEQSHITCMAYSSQVRPAAAGGSLQMMLTDGENKASASDDNPTLEQVKASFVAPYSRIMLASRIGDAALISQLINEQNGIQYSYTTGNLTPLCLAAESGNIAAVQTLLHHGVGVNSTFGTRSSASLCAALSSRQLEVTRLLVCRGASYTHRNINGWSPLFYIWMKEEVQAPATKLLQLLSKFSDFALLHNNVYDICGWSVMHRAAAYGTAEDVAMLISFGLNPLQKMKPVIEEGNESYYHEWSVLHIAVYYGRLDTCRVLLPYYETARCMNMPDKQGWTLLHFAIDQGHLDIARLLIESGADTNAQTKLTWSGKPDDDTGYEYTPLLLAEEVGLEYYQNVFELIESTPVKSQSNTTTPEPQSLDGSATPK